MSLPSVVSPFDLDGALQQEAGRELLAMMTGLPAPLIVPLLRYVGLFRPTRQQLGFGRAMRLVREVLELLPEQLDLQLSVLAETSRLVDQVGALGARKPLGNHRQLRLGVAAAMEQAQPPQSSARKLPGAAPAYGTLSSAAANAGEAHEEAARSYVRERKSE